MLWLACPPHRDVAYQRVNWRTLLSSSAPFQSRLLLKLNYFRLFVVVTLVYCRSFYQSMRDRQNILGKGFVESLNSCDRKLKRWKPRIPYFTALAPPFVSLISLLWGTKMWQKDVSEETRLSCWCNEKHRDTYAGDGATLACPNWDILQMTGYAALTCFWQECQMKIDMKIISQLILCWHISEIQATCLLCVPVHSQANTLHICQHVYLVN